jgi:hypothetical protein
LCRWERWDETFPFTLGNSFRKYEALRPGIYEHDTHDRSGAGEVGARCAFPERSAVPLDTQLAVDRIVDDFVLVELLVGNDDSLAVERVKK